METGRRILSIISFSHLEQKTPNGHGALSPSFCNKTRRPPPTLITTNTTAAEAAGDWDFSSGEENSTDDVNDEEIFYTSTSVSKLQFRSGVSKAKWKSEIGMAEVIGKEGKLWITRGMIRHGKSFCSVEETLFMVEIGALVVMVDNGASLLLKDIYGKIAEGKVGCCWEPFEAYSHLKSLGYIVGRHGVPWSMKGVDNSCNSSSFQGMIESYGMVETEQNDTTSIAQMLSNFAGGSVEADI